MSNDSYITKTKEQLIKEILEKYGLDSIFKEYEECTKSNNRMYNGYIGNPIYIWNQVYNHALNIQMYKIILQTVYDFNVAYKLDNAQTKFDDFRIYLEKQLYKAKQNNIITSYKTTINSIYPTNRYFNSYYNKQRELNTKYIFNVHYSFDAINEKKSNIQYNYTTVKVLDDLNLVSPPNNDSIFGSFLI